VTGVDRDDDRGVELAGTVVDGSTVGAWRTSQALVAVYRPDTAGIGQKQRELAPQKSPELPEKHRIYGEFGLSKEFEPSTIGRGFKSLRAHHIEQV